MLPNENPQQPGGDSVCLPNTAVIKDLARKIIQANPALGWHSAWIKAVRLIRSL